MEGGECEMVSQGSINVSLKLGNLYMKVVMAVFGSLHVCVCKWIHTLRHIPIYYPSLALPPSWMTRPYHILSFASIRLPHDLDILLQKLPLIPRVGHTPHQSRLRHLLKKPNARHLTLPISDILRFDLDERHARIVGAAVVAAVVDAVAQVAEPGRGGLAVDLLDAGVVVGGGGDGARDGSPVLRGAVLEGNLGGIVVFDVREFGGVFGG